MLDFQLFFKASSVVVQTNGYAHRFEDTDVRHAACLISGILGEMGFYESEESLDSNDSNQPGNRVKHGALGYVRFSQADVYEAVGTLEREDRAGWLSNYRQLSVHTFFQELFFLRDSLAKQQ